MNLIRLACRCQVPWSQRHGRGKECTTYWRGYHKEAIIGEWVGWVRWRGGVNGEGLKRSEGQIVCTEKGEMNVDNAALREWVRMPSAVEERIRYLLSQPAAFFISPSYLQTQRYISGVRSRIYGVLVYYPLDTLNASEGVVVLRVRCQWVP